MQKSNPMFITWKCPFAVRDLEHNPALGLSTFMMLEPTHSLCQISLGWLQVISLEFLFLPKQTVLCTLTKHRATGTVLSPAPRLSLTHRVHLRLQSDHTTAQQPSASAHQALQVLSNDRKPLHVKKPEHICVNVVKIYLQTATEGFNGL